MENYETKTESRPEVPAPKPKLDYDKIKQNLLDKGVPEDHANREIEQLKKDTENLVPAEELPSCQIYKMELYPLDGLITIRNKDMSYAKAVKLTPNGKKVFKGKTKMYVKARIFPSGEFRIVKELKSLGW